MISRYLKRFPYAFSGLWYLLRHDFSYQMQVILIGPAILIFGYIFWPLTKTDILFLGIAFILILITEIQNSSFETALNKVHPEHHHEIGRSKDMAAGATLIAGFFLIFVMYIIALYK